MKPHSRSESIAQYVRHIIFTRPCLLENLRLGIINYSALSKLLKKDLEKLLDTKVSESAVKIALIRFAKPLIKQSEIPDIKFAKVMAASSLSLIDDIEVITIDSRKARNVVTKILQLAKTARFFQFTQGVESFTLMIDRETAEQIHGLLKNIGMLSFMKSQAAILMNSPPEIISTPGIISYLTFLLSSRGINVTQIISCHRDTIFIVDMKDALQVYSLLRDAIETFRRYPESLPSSHS